jgi:hypothetical protein
MAWRVPNIWRRSGISFRRKFVGSPWLRHQDTVAKNRRSIVQRPGIMGELIVSWWIFDDVWVPGLSQLFCGFEPGKKWWENVNRWTWLELRWPGLIVSHLLRHPRHSWWWPGVCPPGRSWCSAERALREIYSGNSTLFVTCCVYPEPLPNGFRVLPLSWLQPCK